MKRELIATDHIFADETPLLTLRVRTSKPTVTGKTVDQTTSEQDANNNAETKVTPDSQGKATRRGYIWAYGREGSHGCSW